MSLCAPHNNVVKCDASGELLHEMDGSFQGSVLNDVPFIIHNTFIDYPATRSPSLDEFIKPRLSKSLPCSGIEEVPSEINAIGIDAVAPKLQPSSPQPMTVIRLAQLLSLEPQKNRQFPTEGSRGHHERQCKPCCFVWTEEGCKNGAACNFCHLCDSTEKKRRTKERRKIRAITKFQQVFLGRSSG